MTTSEAESSAEQRPADAVDTPEPPQHTPLWAALASVLERLENFGRRVGPVNVRAPIAIVFTLLAIVLGAIAVTPGDVAVDWRSGSATNWRGLFVVATEHVKKLDAAAKVEVSLALSVGDDDRLIVEVLERVSLTTSRGGTFTRALPVKYGTSMLHPELTAFVVDGVDTGARLSPIDGTDLASAAAYLEPGEHVVEMRYRITDVAQVEDDTLMLSWNLLGAAWPTVIDARRGGGDDRHPRPAQHRGGR